MKTEQKNKNVILKSLTAVALTLPGIQTKSKADAQILVPEADVMYSGYYEGEHHYKIDVFQGALKFPFGKDWDLQLRANTDVQTGHSSSFYAPANFPAFLLWTGSANDIAPVPNGHSKIVNKRSDASAKVRYFGEDKNIGINLYISDENWYISRAVTVEYQQRLNKNNTELTAVASTAGDTLKPSPQTNPNQIGRVGRKTKSTSKGALGLKQDLTDKSFILLGVSFIYDQGYLSDPYKQVYVNGNASPFRAPSDFVFLPGFFLPGLPAGATIVHDLRPKDRKTGVFSFEFVQYIPGADSAVHFNYDFGLNSWKIKAHTFTLAYYQPFCEVWEVAPSVRYYTQGQARFYSYLFNAPNTPLPPFPTSTLPLRNENSSDYRLARFGSVNLEVILSRKFLKDNALKAYTTFGTNIRRNSLHWGHTPHPKNYDNHITTYYISIGGKYRF